MVTVSRLAGITSAAFAASLLFSAQSVTHAQSATAKAGALQTRPIQIQGLKSSFH